MQLSPGSRHPHRRLRRRLEVLAATPGLGAALVLGLLAVPGLVVLARLVVSGGPFTGVGLLAVGALLVGAERLTRPTPGPAIHDRQLDGIVAGLSAATALAVTLSAPDLGAPLLVVPVGLLAVGAVALLAGTRRLWHLRAAPLLLLGAWPTPWAAPLRALVGAVGAGAATTVVVLVVAGVVVALLVAPRLRRRAPRLPHGATVPALPALPAQPAPPALLREPVTVALRVRGLPAEVAS